VAIEVPPFPVGRRPVTGRVADWVELSALARRVAFKRGDLRSAISVEDIEAPERVEEATWAELKWRSELYGDRWPLRLTGQRLTRRSPSPADLWFYRFLCLCGLGSLDDADRQLFELVIAELVSALTGSPSLHVGHPASSGQHASFRQRVEDYVNASGILKQEVMNPLLPDDKDLGLDVVSWIPFRDSRGGAVHFLAQCATGSDWKNKLNDIDLDVWSYHINWCVSPVRVFAVPFALRMAPERWVRLNAQAGMVVDRPRLLELAERVPLSAGLRKAVRKRALVLSVP